MTEICTSLDCEGHGVYRAKMLYNKIPKTWCLCRTINAHFQATLMYSVFSHVSINSDLSGALFYLRDIL